MDRFSDAAVEQFAHDHTEPETDLYARLREETYHSMDRPQMQVGLLEGRFLQMLVRLTGAPKHPRNRDVYRLQHADDG